MGSTPVDEMRSEVGRAMGDAGTMQMIEGLDGYQLGRRLDDGGANEVFEAERPGMAGKVVVKFLHRAVAAGRQATEACRSDHARMARLRHPNLAALVAFRTTAAGVPYLVREHLDGETLEAHLGRRGLMDAQEVVSLVKDIATALAAAHAAGLLHGELRPSKVLLTEAAGYPGGFVKLVDLGLWRLTGDRRGPGAHAEDIRLAAPELIAGDHPADGQADQFSLAAITYRMLTGVDAFPGDDVTAVVRSIMEQSPQLPEIASSDPALGSVLRRGLARDPRDRFPGILEFAAALDIVLSSAVPGAPDAYEETTDMMRTKTANDIMSALSAKTDPPDYAKLVEVVRPRSRQAAPEADAAALDGLSVEAGAEAKDQPASGQPPEAPPSRPARARSRRVEGLTLAAALLSAAAGFAWWAGLVPSPEWWQPASVWESVVSLTQG